MPSPLIKSRNDRYYILVLTVLWLIALAWSAHYDRHVQTSSTSTANFLEEEEMLYNEENYFEQ